VLAILFIGATFPTPLYPLYDAAFCFGKTTLPLVYVVYVLARSERLGRFSKRMSLPRLTARCSADPGTFNPGGGRRPERSSRAAGSGRLPEPLHGSRVHLHHRAVAAITALPWRASGLAGIARMRRAVRIFLTPINNPISPNWTHGPRAC
jgi:hypothetical protein